MKGYGNFTEAYFQKLETELKLGLLQKPFLQYFCLPKFYKTLLFKIFVICIYFRVPSSIFPITYRL